MHHLSDAVVGAIKALACAVLGRGVARTTAAATPPGSYLTGQCLSTKAHNSEEHPREGVKQCETNPPRHPATGMSAVESYMPWTGGRPSPRWLSAWSQPPWCGFCTVPCSGFPPGWKLSSRPLQQQRHWPWCSSSNTHKPARRRPRSASSMRFSWHHRKLTTPRSEEHTSELQSRQYIV